MGKIFVIKYGESVFHESSLFKGGDPKNMLPISFVIYLIQEDNRNILVDVGCNDGAGFEMSQFSEPVKILRDYGIMPEKVTDIIITHHHHDHIQAIADYPNAVVHIQEEEHNLVKDFIPETFIIDAYKEQKTLLPNLNMKKIGGHSIGSSVVFYEQDKKKYLFCGDECYLKANFDKHIITGASYAPEVSKQFIEDYGNGEYELLLFHDPDIMKGKVGISEIERVRK